MIYLNEIGDRITEAEALAIGTWDTVYKECTQVWLENTPEIGEYVTVSEYPNGGADVEWRVTTPATGKWVAYDDNGNEYQAEEEPPADFPHDAIFYETVEFRYARPKTEYEILADEQREAQAQKMAERENMLDALASVFTDELIQSDKVGFLWKVVKLGEVEIMREYVTDPNYDPDAEDGTYLKPYTYIAGMEVIETKWYTDGSDIWECIKSGIPTGFDDTEYFDIIA